jgi:hypothetical protein
MQAPAKLFHSIIIIGAAMGTGCASADSTTSDAQTDGTQTADAQTSDGDTGIPVVGDVNVSEIDSAYDGAPMPWW